MRQTEGELTEPLTEFAIRRHGPDSPNEAWNEYTFWEDAPMDPESEPEVETSFPQWFLFCWTPDNALKEESERLPEIPVAMCFLEEQPGQVEPFQRRFIEETCSQPYSFFMVAGVEPGRHLMLKDLLLEREFRVLERSSSQMLVKGQILYTRVVTLDGVSIMVGCAPVAIPAEFVNELIDFREKIKSRFLEMDWEEYGVSKERLEAIFDEMLFDAVRDRDLELRDMYYAFRDRVLDNPFPQVRNTDGDEMQPVNLHYTLSCSAREAFDALKSLALGESEKDLLMDASFDGQGELGAVRFPWLRKGSKAHGPMDNTILGMLDIKGDKLVIEINSHERAETIKRKITRRLGKRAALRNEVFVSLEAMLAEAASQPRAPQPPDEDLMDLPEVQEKIRGLTERHWATWPDISLPALEGQTPRQAAGTPLGRERLEALLLDFEGRSERRPGPSNPDVAALRRELGLGD